MNKLAQLLTAIGDLKKEAARFTLPREIYIPNEIRNMDPLLPKGTDLIVYQWDETDEARGIEKFYALVFKGRANKPLLNGWFRTLQSRKSEIQRLVASNLERAQYKDEQKRLLKEKKDALAPKVGDILYRSWGYDQTQVDFYQVTKALPKAVEIRPIKSKVVRDEGSAVYVVAVPNTFSGPPEKKVPQPSWGSDGGYSVKVSSNGHANLWDGKPKYETGLGWGH